LVTKYFFPSECFRFFPSIRFHPSVFFLFPPPGDSSFFLSQVFSFSPSPFSVFKEFFSFVACYRQGTRTSFLLSTFCERAYCSTFTPKVFFFDFPSRACLLFSDCTWAILFDSFFMSGLFQGIFPVNTIPPWNSELPLFSSKRLSAFSLYRWSPSLFPTRPSGFPFFSFLLSRFFSLSLPDIPLLSLRSHVNFSSFFRICSSPHFGMPAKSVFPLSLRFINFFFACSFFPSRS